MISKALNVSIGNITEDDRNFLEKKGVFSVGNFHYGFFVNIAAFSNRSFTAEINIQKHFIL